MLVAALSDVWSRLPIQPRGVEPMFKDHTLLPAEAVRLAALGLLAEEPRRYGDLATEIRHFIALAVGPSLDLMGSSIELLRYEGLARPLTAPC